MTESRFSQEVFDAWLLDQSPDIHDLARNVRSVIVAAGFNFKEGIKWGTPAYWLPEVSRRNICYIAPHKDYVRLGFFNGASMSDPDDLLEGTGKRLRHIKVYEVTDSNRVALTDYVRASVKRAIEEPGSLSR